MRMLTISLLAGLLAAPAIADESWKTSIGPVIWEKDYDGGAIFRVETGNDNFARFYIEGLTAEDESRGHFSGFWINSGEEDLCSAMLTGPDGLKSHTWGRLSLTFVDERFPSEWTMLTADCMSEPTDVLVGKLENR